MELRRLMDVHLAPKHLRRDKESRLPSAAARDDFVQNDLLSLFVGPAAHLAVRSEAALLVS